MIEVKQYDDSHRECLKQFCNQMAQDGFAPWSSLDRLRLNKTTYFVAYYQNRIIAITGVYEYKPKQWIPLTRVATLSRYRNLLVPTRTYGSASVPTKLLWLPAVNYALDNGAEHLITHLNFKDANTGVSQYYNKKTERLIKLGLCEYDGIEKINGVYQDKFILLMPTYKQWLEKLNEEPLRLRNESI